MSSVATSNAALPYYVSALVTPTAVHWGSGPVGSGAVITYSFMERLPSYANATDAYNFQPMNDPQRTMIRNALSTWSDLANITFREVPDAGDGGMMRFGTNNQRGASGAYAYYPDGNTYGQGGDVYISNDQAAAAYPRPGTFNFTALIHEIGHGLGLKHPGNYNGNSGSESGPFLPSGEDNYQYTVMSYNANPSMLQNSGQPMTPGLYDTAAIQYLYGANTSAAPGNDVYNFTDPERTVTRVIWDPNGFNTINAAGQQLATTIDLRPGHLSSIGSDGVGGRARNNVSIAYGSQVRAANGGSGANTIVANDGGCVLVGGSAADVFFGGAGSDTINGGAGRDVFCLQGARADYDIANAGNGVVAITDRRTGVRDLASSIETLTFSDGYGTLQAGATTIQVQHDKAITLAKNQGSTWLRISAPVDGAGGALTAVITGLPSGATVHRADGRSLSVGEAVQGSELPGLTISAATGFVGGAGDLRYAVTSTSGETAMQTVHVSVRADAPAAAFDPLRYLAANSDLAAAFGTDTAAATWHWQTSGQSEGRTVNGFNPLSYLAANPDVMAAYGTNTAEATRHFLQFGSREGRSKGSFDPLAYMASNGDVASAFNNDPAAATAHYVNNGRAEGRVTTFDVNGYMAANPDVAAAYGNDPVAAEQHYLQFGRLEGRQTTFDAMGYLAVNADVAAAYGNDVVAATNHYLAFGIMEGRDATFDAAAYEAANPHIAATYGDNLRGATEHYVQWGRAAGLPTAPALSSSLASTFTFTADASRSTTAMLANYGISA